MPDSPSPLALTRAIEDAAGRLPAPHGSIEHWLGHDWTPDTVAEIRRLAWHAEREGTAWCAYAIDRWERARSRNAPERPRLQVLTEGLLRFADDVVTDLIQGRRNAAGVRADPHKRTYTVTEALTVAISWSALLVAVRDSDLVTRLGSDRSTGHHGRLAPIGAWDTALGVLALSVIAAGHSDRADLLTMPHCDLNLDDLATQAALRGACWPNGHRPPGEPDKTLIGLTAALSTEYQQTCGRDLATADALRLAEQGWTPAHLARLRAFANQAATTRCPVFLPAGAVSDSIWTLENLPTTWAASVMVMAEQWQAAGIPPEATFPWIAVALAAPASLYRPTTGKFDRLTPLPDPEVLATWHAAFGDSAPLLLAAGLTVDEASEQTEAGTLPDENTLRTMAVLRGYRLARP